MSPQKGHVKTLSPAEVYRRKFGHEPEQTTADAAVNSNFNLFGKE